MKKKTKKESHKKKRETIFQDTRERQNTDKQNVKKVCPAQNETDKIILKVK